MKPFDLVFLGNTFDSGSVFEQFRKSNRPVLLLEETVGHQFSITRSHPLQTALPELPWGGWRFRNTGPLKRILFPIYYAVHILRFGRYLFSLREKGIRVRTVYILYGHYAMILPLLKSWGLLDRWVFVMGDWFAESRGSLPWSRIGSRIVTPRIFRYTCSRADRTVYITREIRDAQRAFWGREISRDHVIYEPILQSLTRGPRKKTDVFRILFLGNILPQSGLEALREILIRQPDFRLVFIGPPSPLKDRFLADSKLAGVSRQVEDLGFLDRPAIPKAARDCHCGINLLTEKVYSHFTLPAKIMDYLQCGLPVVCTEWVGPYQKVIRERGLGQVLPGTLQGLESSLLRLSRAPQQAAFRRRIEEHLSTCSGTFYPDL